MKAMSEALVPLDRASALQRGDAVSGPIYGYANFAAVHPFSRLFDDGGPLRLAVVRVVRGVPVRDECVAIAEGIVKRIGTLRRAISLAAARCDSPGREMTRECRYAPVVSLNGDHRRAAIYGDDARLCGVGTKMIIGIVGDDARVALCSNNSLCMIFGRNARVSVTGHDNTVAVAGENTQIVGSESNRIVQWN